MSKLVKLLEYVKADRYDKEKMLKSDAFKNVMGRPAIKRLTLSEEMEELVMVQEEVLDTVIDGARQHAWIRDAVPVVKTDSYKTRLVKNESPVYAEIVPEMGEFPVQTSSYDPIDVVVKKFGTRPMITSEMIEDCRFDSIELEIAGAGARMENALNRYALSEMLDKCTSVDIDPTTFISASELVKATEKIKDKNGFPDTVLMHQSAEGKLFDESNYAGFSTEGNGETKLFGLKHYTATVSTLDSATAKWDGTDAGNHYNAFVFDSARYGRVVMREDLKVSEMDDPIHDLLEIIVSMRAGFGVTKTDAGVRILTK